MRGKLTINFRLPSGAVRQATGREAQSILALVNAGPRGITSLDTFRAGWAARLSAYIFDLKKMGVPIEATREPHDGGNHARYRLAAPIEIIHRSGDIDMEIDIDKMVVDVGGRAAA